AAPRRTAFGCIDCGIDAKLGDRFEGDVETGIGLLSLLLYAGGVNPIERVVVVIARASYKTNTGLTSTADVDRAGRESHQGGPIAAVDRDIAQLPCFDYRSNLGVALFERLRPCLDFDAGRNADHIQLHVDGSRLP